MQNPVIRIAILATRICMLFIAVVYTVFLAMVIYWHIEPTAFEEWKMAQPYQAGSAGFSIQKGASASGFTFNEIGAPMLYWLIFRTTIFLVLIWLVIRKIQKVLISVNERRTFFAENVGHFKKLAILGVAIATLSMFNFGTINGQTTFNFSIPFEPLLFSLTAWVLAEIFREGGKLREDSNSII